MLYTSKMGLLVPESTDIVGVETIAESFYMIDSFFAVKAITSKTISSLTSQFKIDVVDIEKYSKIIIEGYIKAKSSVPGTTTRFRHAVNGYDLTSPGQVLLSLGIEASAVCMFSIEYNTCAAAMLQKVTTGHSSNYSSSTSSSNVILFSPSDVASFNFMSSYDGVSGAYMSEAKIYVYGLLK